MSDAPELIFEPFRFPRYDVRLEQALCRAPRERIVATQFERLRHAVRYAYDRVPFYRERWEKVGARPDDIGSLEDFQKLPTWNVHDQRESIDSHPPFGSHYVVGPDIKEWMAEAVETANAERLIIRVERAAPGDDAFRERLERELRRRLNLGAVSIVLVPPGGTAKATGAGREPKVRRVFDRRRQPEPA